MRQVTLDEWLGKERKIIALEKKTRVPEMKWWQHWKEALPLTKTYQEIKIPKRRGGFRIISIPPEKLKKTQREILRFLKRLFRTWCLQIHGLYRGSYVEHARIHSKSRFVFQFDIKDAFPSVNLFKLKQILHRKILWENIVDNEPEAEELAYLLINLTTFNEILPQGAPTSPFLFYIYIMETDLIGQLYRCRPRGQEMEISCYVDGIVVSSQKLIPPDIKEKMIKTVEKSGLKVNEKKIWQKDCRNGNPMITGLSIDGKGKISLPKRRIRKWRGIIHRAALEADPCAKTDLGLKIEGFIASLKPIYGKDLPPQIEKPYSHFKQSQNKPAQQIK
jgi:hypothetical protein